MSFSLAQDFDGQRKDFFMDNLFPGKRPWTKPLMGLVRRVAISSALFAPFALYVLFVPKKGLADRAVAQKDAVRIFESHSSRSKVVGQLKKGQGIAARYRYGAFWAVDLPQGKIGYVRGLEVKIFANSDSSSSAKNFESSQKKLSMPSKNDAARQRVSTAVMGVRGLAADADISARTEVMPNYEAVAHMENFRTSEPQIAKLQEDIFKELETLPMTISSGPSERASDFKIADQAKGKMEEVGEDITKEIELGRQMAALVLALRKPTANRKMVNQLNVLTNWVARSSPYQGRKWMAEVLEDETPNAFACPGGYIFVTTGLLKKIENEAQLAGVLAHEVTHVGERHIFQVLNKKRTTEQETKDMADNNSEVINSRKRVEPPRSEVGEFVSAQLAARSFTSSLQQLSQEGFSLLFEKGFEPELELESDKKALIWMNHAGYDAREFTTLFQKLDSQPSKTHPAFEKRNAELQKTISADPALASPGAVGKTRFENWASGL
jgi:beta-barrel assembly-enhancing protease